MNTKEGFEGREEMKKLLMFAFLAAGAVVCRATEYKAGVSGDFLVVSQKGGFSENIVSVRKSAILSAQLEGKRIVLVTAVTDGMREMKDGRDRRLDRALIYTFDNDSDGEAKQVFEFIMKELGAQLER